LVSVDPTLTRK